LGILVAQFKYRGKTRWFSRLNSLSSWDAPTVAEMMSTHFHLRVAS
jgi:hypothetical protein